ncbi:MAG: hypothetical protein ACE5KQ_06275 [Thermoplasmata archaeon]
MASRGKGEKSQFNIRMDTELLQRYRDFCDRNGLDPHGQVINFMRRLVESEYDFQEKLWEILREQE